MLKRYLEKQILEDLKEKMVFISGPRQVGKTTLAREIGEEHFANSFEYLNWDFRDDRRRILANNLPADKRLIIYDEIHKYRDWKNHLKGQYDKYKNRLSFLVTGSARLDIYKKGGDSLLGRYHACRLHPLSLGELLGRPGKTVINKELNFPAAGPETREKFFELLKFGGFPEVFVRQNEKNLRRWHNERVDRLIKEDIRDVQNLRDISALQVLVELLPSKVGALFSLNSLKEDLGVTHKTIALWVEILEKFYYHFRIYPFQSSLIKSLRKEPKIYLWDWSELADVSVRLENMVAGHLLKLCDFLLDVEGYKARLFYIRDLTQKEVDFLVAVDGRPWFCVEVKSSSKSASAALCNFKEKLKVPFAYQLTLEKNVDFIQQDIRIIEAAKFLSALV